MRLIKIKIPSEILLNFGFLDFFQEIESIEIIQIYQYDQNNFFALQKIVVKPSSSESIEQILNRYFETLFVQVLETHGRERLCLMKQRKTAGFWPLLLAGSWALIPPIYINPEHIIFGLLIKEDEQMPRLLEQLHVFKSYDILSISKPDEIIHNSSQGSPQLTSRQREIMSYATTHGYYEIPKKISTYQLADYFEMSPAGISNHIQKAERALMKFHFG